ncbi:hypothetical protein Syun_005499 [Stephania yunnanensis]|uniref:Uncharacterized protein n=1 Tax=Stephania yunnanensis TaxID=152371 RepID=A0AAP0L6B2_9MAGN
MESPSEFLHSREFPFQKLIVNTKNPSPNFLINTLSHTHRSIIHKKMVEETNDSCFSSSSPLLISNSVLLSSFSNGQLELIAIRNMSYTSLKDLAPSSPPPATGEIPIKNRLVKQAAWAYLQPMSPADAFMESRDRSFFRRLGLSFSGNCVAARGGGCFLFMKGGVFPAIGRAFGRVFRAVTRQMMNIGNGSRRSSSSSGVDGCAEDSF